MSSKADTWRKGKEFFHPVHGNVKFVEPVKRIFAIVEEIDRGPGWDPDNKKYVGIRSGRGWHLGKNYCFGAKHKVRKDELRAP